MTHHSQSNPPRRLPGPPRPADASPAERARARLQAKIREMRRLCRDLPPFQGWKHAARGVPVGYVDAKPAFLDFEGHSITIGATGEGKFTSVIAPMALHDVRDSAGVSCGMVFVDPKNGEAARASASYRRLHKEELVFVIDPYGVAGGADALNPFDFLDPEAPDFYEACSGLASALIVQRPAGKRGGEFIWDARGAEWLRAMIAHLALDPEETGTIMRLREIFSASLDEFLAVLLAMKENPASPAWVRNTAKDMERVTRTAEKEQSGYLATIMEATQFADSALMSRRLTHSTFDPKLVRDLGATVYIVSDERYADQSGPWQRLMCEVIKQRILASRARRTVHWVIDEARTFDAWSFIENGLRALRSERISLHLFYQNIGQLKAIWGEGWSSITDTKLIRYLGSSDVETCQWIAQLAGETSVLDYSRAETDTETESAAQARARTKSSAQATARTLTQTQSQADATSRARMTSDARARSSSQTASNAHARSRSETSGTTNTVGSSHSISVGYTETKNSSGTIGSTSGPNGGVSLSSTSGSATSETTTDTWTTFRSLALSNSTTHGTSDTRTDAATRGMTATRTNGLTDTTSATTTQAQAEAHARTATQTEGESDTDTTTRALAKGRTKNVAERRRLLTVDEVRRLPKDSVLLFLDRQPECVVKRMHYHETPPLLARVLESWLLFPPPERAR